MKWLLGERANWFNKGIACDTLFLCRKIYCFIYTDGPTALCVFITLSLKMQEASTIAAITKIQNAVPTRPAAAGITHSTEMRVDVVDSNEIPYM